MDAVVHNAWKTVKGLPGPILLEMAEAGLDDPVNFTKDLLLYAPAKFLAVMDIANPYATPEEMRWAKKELVEDPLGPFFAVGMTRGAVRLSTNTIFTGSSLIAFNLKENRGLSAIAELILNRLTNSSP